MEAIRRGSGDAFGAGYKPELENKDVILICYKG
jgi:hypothetical protein